MKSFWLKLFCNFPECRQLGSTPLRTTGTHKHKKQEDYSTDLDGPRDIPQKLQFKNDIKSTRELADQLQFTVSVRRIYSTFYVHYLYCIFYSIHYA
jgi:hypothetical protein